MDALIRLNPEIGAQPDRADDVLYRLRAILMGVRTDGLVKASEGVSRHGSPGSDRCRSAPTASTSRAAH